MRNLHAKSLVLALVLVFGSVPAHADDFATSNLGSNRVTWDVAGSYDRAVLTVSRPDGTVFRKEFKSTVVPSFDLVDKAGNVAADGAYTWQIVLSPRLGAAQKDALAAARRATDPSVEARILAAAGLDKTRIQSGTFSVAGGSTVPADLQEPVATHTPAPRATGGNGLVGSAVTPGVIGDLIVQGSACVGLDCVNDENLGFDTIRLKENNTRIKFDDTSTGTGFPANDWQLTANDSTSGGSSKFSIEDSTSAKTPFTVTAGAATNSIFVDSTGRIGLRTSTPVLDLHVNTSNTPALRLEQNNSGGFTAQTWDIGANEQHFFVRDATSGSRLPFRIRPGAPTSSIDISSDGDVGIGTASPFNKLHVTSSASGSTDGKVLISNTSGTAAGRELLELNNNGGAILILKDTGQTPRWSFGTAGTNFVIDNQGNTGLEVVLTNTGNMTVAGNVGIGTASPSNKLHVTSSASGVADGKVLVSNTSGTTAGRELLELNNNGGAIVILKDTSQTPRWSFGTVGTSFVIDNQANTGLEMLLSNTGNMFVVGTVTPGSSREIKQDFAKVDTREALNKVLALPITSWAYKTDQSVRHIGPMAEDFFDAFSVGGTNKGISVTDSAGVTFAAIQGLNQLIQEKDQKLAELKAQNEQLASRLSNLEKMMQELAAKQK